MTSTEVTMYQQSSLASRAQYATTLAGAKDLIPRGLFDQQTGRPSPAKILLVMETGAMLGLAPMAALAGIDVIEGRAAISPRVMLGLFRSRGHKVEIVETGTVEGGDLQATVTLIRKDDPEMPITASFSLRDALRAELVDSYAPGPDGAWVVRARSKQGKVLPWEAYPQDMVVWRAVSRIGRRGGQDVLMGIGYIPEELEVLVDEEGTRSAPDVEAEEDLIARFKKLDDKKDMADVWAKNHVMGLASDAWTARVDAEFSSHLSTLTKDSRPPKDGAPGQTGEPAIDEPGATDEGVIVGEIVDDPDDAAVEPYYDEDPSAGARRMAELEQEQEEQRRAACGEPERTADGMIPPGAGLKAAREAEARGGFNAGALGEQ